MIEVSIGLGWENEIKYVGKLLNDNRWDYEICKNKLLDEDHKLLKRYGLKVVIPPEETPVKEFVNNGYVDYE